MDKDGQQLNVGDTQYLVDTWVPQKKMMQRMDLHGVTGKTTRKILLVGTIVIVAAIIICLAFIANKSQPATTSTKTRNGSLTELGVHRYNNTPGLVIGGAGHLFDDPWGVDIDSTASRIYVTDYNNHRICVYTMSGQLILHFSRFVSPHNNEDNFMWPRGIAVTEDSLLVVGDNHRVMVLSLTNMTVLQFWGMRGTSGNELGQFYHPTGIATDKNIIYVADSGNNRVQVLNCLNQVTSLLTERDNRDLTNPFDVAINVLNGHIYVADNNEVVQYNTTGQYLTKIAPADLNQTSIRIRSIAVDSQGQVYLNDGHNGCIHVIARDGDYLQRLGRKGTCQSCLREPTGIAVHSKTREIVVTDILKNEMQIYMPLK